MAEMDKKNKEKEQWEGSHPKLTKFIYNFVLWTLIASVVILIILIILAPSASEAGASESVHPKSYYTLMLAESILGCFCMYLPKFVEKKGHIYVPSYLLIPFVIFLYCAIFLGETRSFYYRFSNWDTILHFMSAAMSASLAYSLVSILNQSNKVPMQLSPLFLAIFAFCFAVTIGAVWEIYEYTADGILQTNMQKFMLEDGTQLVGRAALSDTMHDIITDVVGAGIVSILGYVSMKKFSVSWLNKRQLKIESDSSKVDR